MTGQWSIVHRLNQQKPISERLRLLLQLVLGIQFRSSSGRLQCCVFGGAVFIECFEYVFQYSIILSVEYYQHSWIVINGNDIVASLVSAAFCPFLACCVYNILSLLWPAMTDRSCIHCWTQVPHVNCTDNKIDFSFLLGNRYCYNIKHSINKTVFQSKADHPEMYYVHLTFLLVTLTMPS